MELTQAEAIKESKQGYMKTELGLFPDNWQIVPLGSLGNFAKGQGIRKDEIQSEGIPCVRYGEIYTVHNDVIRKFYSFIEKDVAVKSRKLKAGDLLFAGSGETKEEIGKCVGFTQQVEAYAGSDIVILSLKRGDPEFLSYLMNTPVIQKQKASRGQGDAVVHISSSALSAVLVPLPPTEKEQRAIATALSDVDALLTSLDQLIAKKKAIKQGAMQQLLTGKKRLPGFKGKWEVKRLEEVAFIKTGTKNNEDKVEGGTYPFFVRSEQVERINSFSHDCEAILVPGEGRIGDIFHYINGKFDVHQRVYAITEFKRASARFIHAYMRQFFGAWAMQNTVKATVDSLRLPTFKQFELTLPPTIEEQSAIAIVLVDMESGIEALEARREKTVLLKQGMMQELLTGKTRLV